MNVLITGSSGQLGSELKYLVMNNKLEIINENDSKFFFTDKNELDIKI